MPRRVAISPIGFIVAARAISMSVAMDGPLPVGARFSQSRKLRKREFLRPLQSYRPDAQDDSGGAVKRPGGLSARTTCVAGATVLSSRFVPSFGGRVDPFFAILVVVAVLAGIGMGWVLGSRPVAEWKVRHGEREQAAREHEAGFRQAAAELGEARIEIATLRANADNFDRQIAQLNEARAERLTQFKAAGSEVLPRAQEDFLKRAEERFGSSEKANKQAVAALLEPVNQRLRSYEEQVRTLESQRVDAFGQLTGLIQSLRDGQEAVRSAAQQLGNSLCNAFKARGRWGEQQLRNVLEQCGLAEHTDFVTEHSVDTDEGRLRPDAIVRVPGNKLLVIDAKVSLNAYQEAFEATDDEQRARHLDLHAASMRNHIQTLGAKS